VDPRPDLNVALNRKVAAPAQQVVLHVSRSVSLHCFLISIKSVKYKHIFTQKVFILIASFSQTVQCSHSLVGIFIDDDHRTIFIINWSNGGKLVFCKQMHTKP